MPDDLYLRDILEWSAREAERLRRLSRGERVNEVDWENVIEEVESVGRSEFSSVESLLARALEHVAKAAAWPDGRDVEHWSSEASTFLRDAGRRLSPSMRQKLDVDRLWRDALRDARRRRLYGRPAGPLPDAPPFGLDDLLDEEADPADLAARVRQAAGAGSDGSA